MTVMDEKRRYFRIKNTGQIEARIDMERLNILELSNSGAVIDDTIALPRVGKFDLKIHTYITKINYEILRLEPGKIILGFTNTDEKESLFFALKTIRDQKRADV